MFNFDGIVSNRPRKPANEKPFFAIISPSFKPPTFSLTYPDAMRKVRQGFFAGNPPTIPKRPKFPVSE
jgi:hypothetical protein